MREDAHGVLVVEPDRSSADAVSALTQRAGFHPRVVDSVGKAERALSAVFVGVIFSVGLPDGSGYELVAPARCNAPALPMLAMSTSIDVEAVNQSGLLGVRHAIKPNVGPNVESFLRGVAIGQPGVRFVVEELQAKHRLTEAEKRLLLTAAMTTSRKRMAELLEVSTNTVKRQATSVLAKTGHVSLEDLAELLRRRALRF